LNFHENGADTKTLIAKLVTDRHFLIAKLVTDGLLNLANGVARIIPRRKGPSAGFDGMPKPNDLVTRKNSRNEVASEPSVRTCTHLYMYIYIYIFVFKGIYAYIYVCI